MSYSTAGAACLRAARRLREVPGKHALRCDVPTTPLTAELKLKTLIGDTALDVIIASGVFAQCA
jgi:hypothetical protein